MNIDKFTIPIPQVQFAAHVPPSHQVHPPSTPKHPPATITYNWPVNLATPNNTPNLHQQPTNSSRPPSNHGNSTPTPQLNGTFTVPTPQQVHMTAPSSFVHAPPIGTPGWNLTATQQMQQNQGDNLRKFC